MATDDFKKKVQFTIPEDQVPSIQQYMETHGIESVNQAMKSLITEALAVSPRDGAVIAACRRAFLSVQQMLLESTGRFYSDMLKQSNSYIGEIAATRFRCPHCNNEL